MKQLTGVDLSFLLMETDHTYGHVNGLSIYERPSETFDPFTAVKKRLGIMVDHLEPLRRKLVEVPFDLDRPYWIEDADFDLDFHVRHLGLAPPGAADQLAEQVARIVGRRMDRTRPLWEAYVIEGLADDRWALLQKTHHATIDGASGVLVLKMFSDESRDAEWGFQSQEWFGEEPPSPVSLLKTAAVNIAVNPLKGARASVNIARNLAGAAGVSNAGDIARQAQNALGSLAGRPKKDSRANVRVPLTPAPSTPWNKSVSPHRRFAMRATSLENLKRLKVATGGTLNDVVMAICTGALRDYLIEKDALPDSPLRAMVPVSIRTGQEENPWTNRVSAVVADLPTNAADPLERVSLCREAMNVAKHQFDLMPAEALGEAADYASPVVAAGALRLVSRLKLADRVNMPVNVVISNVPGPRQPLYFEGAKLEAYIPVSTITDGIGLNITVHSYGDRMDFGLIADRDLVPDLWHLADLHIAQLEKLFAASGAEWAVPQPPPPMRRGGDGVEPVGPSSEAVEERMAARRSVTRAPSSKPAKKAKKSTSKKASGEKSGAKKANAKKSSTAVKAAKKKAK